MSRRHTGHRKRLAASNRIVILKKESKYLLKTGPGPHADKNSLPLLIVLRDVLGFATNAREAKQIVNSNKVQIDGKFRKDLSFPIGIMDVIHFPTINKSYRATVGKNGKMRLFEIKETESKLKLCKVLDKTILGGGKIQLNLHDGRNMIVHDKHYKTGDSILLKVPEQKVEKHIAREKGTHVFILEGTHIGETATLNEFKPQPGSKANRVNLTNEAGETFETLEKYIFVTGKEKPEIDIGEK